MRLPAIVAAAALTLASCGDSGSDDAASTTSAATSASTTAAETTVASTTTTTTVPTTVTTTAGPTSTTVASTSTSTSAATTTSVGSTTGAGPAGPAGPTVGEPVVVAEGSVTAVSPDGSHLVVSDVVEGLSEPGCEGEPEPVLLRVPIGGGAAVPMFEDGPQHNGNLDVLDDGRAVLLAGCEEFLDEILVFAWSADGRLSDPVVVPRFSGDVIENMLGVAWSEADLIGGLGTTFTFEGLDTRVVSVDTATGAVTDLLPADNAIVVGRLAGDSVAIGDGETVRVVPLGGGPAALEVAGEWLAVRPDGTAVAVVGPGITLHGQDGEPEALPVDAPDDAPVIDLSWSPDGRYLAYIARGVEDTVGVVELGAGATSVDAARRVFGLAWSVDGSVLGYTRIREETGEQLGAPEAMAVRLTPT